MICFVKVSLEFISHGRFITHERPAALILYWAILDSPPEVRIGLTPVRGESDSAFVGCPQKKTSSLDEVYKAGLTKAEQEEPAFKLLRNQFPLSCSLGSP
jgi:hypothetical protein